MKKFIKKNYKWFILILCAFIFAITQFKPVMYLPVLVQLMRIIKKCNSNEYFDLLLLTIIVPDNYLIIPIIIAVFILLKLPFLDNKKNAAIGIIAIFYTILVSFLNKIPFINYIVYIVYFIPFCLSLLVLKQLVKRKDFLINKLYNSITFILISQWIAIVFYTISHLSIVKAYNDMDWVTGTFGAFQCNTLMLFACFCFLIFVNDYVVNKKLHLLPIILSLLTIISTSSVAYLLIFFLSFLVILFLSAKIKPIQRIIFILLLLLSILIMVSILPEWIVREFALLLDFEYAKKRISKIIFYYTTFVKIPKEEGIITFLFGGGLGQYVSRAALTCAGGYIGFYDSRFTPYVSDLYKTYILDFYNGLPGLADSPQSSILALQGEVGLIGLGLIMWLLIKNFKKTKNITIRVCILFFVGIMFVENILEFAKVCFMFWAVIAVCGFKERRNFDAKTNANWAN